MIRSRMLAGVFGLSTLTALLLFTLSVPVSGVPAPASKTVPPPSMVAPAQVDCAQTPGTSEISILVVPEPGFCPADATQAANPDVMRGGRTCRCSCGYPCKSDADCGGAIGSCRGGISCC